MEEVYCVIWTGMGLRGNMPRVEIEVYANVHSATARVVELHKTKQIEAGIYTRRVKEEHVPA